MIDPLPSCPAIISALIRPVADSLGLQTLPLHAHEVLLAFAVYNVLFIRVSPALSSRYFPAVYPSLPVRTKVNWNIHAVSQFQSVLICSIALWVLLNDGERQRMDRAERVWGYTGAMGMTQALAAGYFAWDTVVSAVHLDVLGPGSLAHAISALIVTSLGFRPFANFYGIAFVLYEISTPFLNLHWFFDKCNMTGSRLQLYNGIALLVAFFGCRLAWGTYQTVCVYQDVWQILQAPVNSEIKSRKSLPLGLAKVSPDTSELMRFSGGHDLPPWLAYTYLISNTTLTCLNMYWFWKMIEAVQKRFSSPKKVNKSANE